MEEKQVSDELSEALTGYFGNDLSEEQAMMIIKWIREDKKNLSMLRETEQIWNALALHRNKGPDVISAWNNVVERINSNDIRRIPGKQVIIRISSLLKIAAMFILLIGIGIGGLLIFSRSSRQIAGNYFESVAPKGSRSVITLPDASTVWLNSGTTLRYSPDFGKELRDIILEGEAYFSVAENKKIPFRVMAGELCITAVGTSFNVKAYSEEGIVETTLESGKVKIEQLDPEGKIISEALILKPKQKAVYIRSTRQLSRSGSDEKVRPEIRKAEVNQMAKVTIRVDNLTDTRLATSWKDSRWVFRSEKLRRMVPILERRYDISIIFRDTVLNNYTFTGTIKEDNLEQVLTALCTAAPVKYEMDRNRVILYEDLERKKSFNINLQPD